jgi:hypothetical protein
VDTTPPGTPPPYRPPGPQQPHDPGSDGDPGARSTPGRGFVIAGIVLMALGALGAIVAVAVFGGRVDLDAFDRDVAVVGARESEVPGRVGFRVIESLSSDEDRMSVGVALSGGSPEVDCEIRTVGGAPVPVRRAGDGDTVVSPEVDGGWDLVVVARDLEPGEYTAVCTAGGEPSGTSGERFTVGRVLTVSEVFDFAGPAFGVLAGVVLGGLLGLLGLVLLVVGLVIGNRARRRQAQPPPWGGPPQWGGPSQWGGPPR